MNSQQAAWIFVSHAPRDLEQVREIYNELLPQLQRQPDADRLIVQILEKANL
jgi:hypothetical protein